MGGFIFFLFLFGCILAFVIPLTIIGFRKKKNLLKNLSDKFNLKRIDENKIKGIIDNQIVHGFFQTEKKGDDEHTYFYLEVRPENERRYNIRSDKKAINFLPFYNKKTDFLTKDTIFDELVSLSVEDDKEAVSKLSYKTRILIKRHSTGYFGLKIYNEYMVFKNNDFDAVSLSNVLKDMITVSKRLSSTKPADELLMENIMSIYEINEVRINNMEYLLESPDLNKYKDFFNSLSDDHVKEIQIMSAFALGEDGVDKLLNTLKGSDNEIKYFALKYLSDLFYHDSVRTHIYTFLDSDDEELIIETINVLIKKGDKNSINIISNFIKTKQQIIELSRGILLNLIEYLTKLEVSDNFEWLVSLLKNHDNDIVIPVINCLIKINDIKAVEYLIPLTKKILNIEIKKSAQDAINILQQNIPKSNRGTLTMMEESISGELSIDADEDMGKLTIDKE